MMASVSSFRQRAGEGGSYLNEATAARCIVFYEVNQKIRDLERAHSKAIATSAEDDIGIAKEAFDCADSLAEAVYASKQNEKWDRNARKILSNAYETLDRALNRFPFVYAWNPDGTIKHVLENVLVRLANEEIVAGTPPQHRQRRRAIDAHYHGNGDGDDDNDNSDDSEVSAISHTDDEEEMVNNPGSGAAGVNTPDAPPSTPASTITSTTVPATSVIPTTTSVKPIATQIITSTMNATIVNPSTTTVISALSTATTATASATGPIIHAEIQHPAMRSDGEGVIPTDAIFPTDTVATTSATTTPLTTAGVGNTPLSVSASICSSIAPSSITAGGEKRNSLPQNSNSRRAEKQDSAPREDFDEQRGACLSLPPPPPTYSDVIGEEIGSDEILKLSTKKKEVTGGSGEVGDANFRLGTNPAVEPPSSQQQQQQQPETTPKEVPPRHHRSRRASGQPSGRSSGQPSGRSSARTSVRTSGTSTPRSQRPDYEAMIQRLQDMLAQQQQASQQQLAAVEAASQRQHEAARLQQQQQREDFRIQLEQQQFLLQQQQQQQHQQQQRQQEDWNQTLRRMEQQEREVLRLSGEVARRDELLRRPVPGPRPATTSEAASGGVEEDAPLPRGEGSTRWIDASVQSLAYKRLYGQRPIPGDRLGADATQVDFERHLRRFKNRVAKVEGATDDMKLQELSYWFDGVVRASLESYVHRDDHAAALQEALQMLQNKWGMRSTTATGMLSECLQGDVIGACDGSGFHELLLRLRQTYELAVETGTSATFDQVETMTDILKKRLPHLSKKWTKKRLEYKLQFGREDWKRHELNFDRFLTFLQYYQDLLDISPSTTTTTPKITASIEEEEEEEAALSSAPEEETSESPDSSELSDSSETSDSSDSPGSTPSTASMHGGNRCDIATAMDDDSPHLQQSPPFFNIDDLDLCPVCGALHSLATCGTFNIMSVAGRGSYIMGSRRCFNCLEAGHLSHECPTGLVCGTCGNLHHPLLHGFWIPPMRRSNPEQPSNEPSE